MSWKPGELAPGTPTRGHASSRTWWGAAAAGVLTPPVIANVMKLLPVPGLSLAVSIGALLLLGWFFGAPFSGKDPIARRAGLAAYVGLGVGVIANVMLEELLFRRWAGQNAWPSTVIYVEHNLWPFELLMWLLGALVLMRLGASKRHASSVRTL